MSTKKTKTKTIGKIGNVQKKGHHILSFIHHHKEVLPESFDIGRFDYIQVKAGNVKFKTLYGRKALWKRYLIAIIVGFVMGTAAQFLIKNTGLYNSGLSGIVQGIARISDTFMIKNNVDTQTATLIFNLLFWVLYILINIPLFIFAYKKIGKTFANLTMVFVIVNSLWGFTLSYIPGTSDVFLFGNTLAEGSGHAWDPSDNVFVKNSIYNIPFWYKPSGSNPEIIFNPDYDPYKAVLLFVYAIIFSLISSVGYTVLYIVGGCSAGGDFISIYQSSIKHKPLGTFMIIVNSSMLFIGFVIGSYVSGGIVDSQGFAFPFFLSANLIASFLYVVLFGILINHLYPLHKFVKVEIISEKLYEIRDQLFASNFTHSMTISKGVGAYSMKEKDILWTICMYIETANLVRHIHKIDPKALTIVTDVKTIDGFMKIYRQGSID